MLDAHFWTTNSYHLSPPPISSRVTDMRYITLSLFLILLGGVYAVPIGKGKLLSKRLMALQTDPMIGAALVSLIKKEVITLDVDLIHRGV
jgi:hypothetical protein